MILYCVSYPNAHKLPHSVLLEHSLSNFFLVVDPYWGQAKVWPWILRRKKDVCHCGLSEAKHTSTEHQFRSAYE